MLRVWGKFGFDCKQVGIKEIIRSLQLAKLYQSLRSNLELLRNRHAGAKSGTRDYRLMVGHQAGNVAW